MKEIAKEFKAIFDPFYQAPIEVWEYFVQHGEVVEKQKNDILKRYNERADVFYFILKGSGGILLFSNNNYICIDLCYEGDLLVDYMSFLTNQPTEIEVICFEKCRLFSISREKFFELSQTNYGRIICQTAAENLFIQKQMQQIEILTKTAKQRYSEMLEKQPHILQRTPNKHIASYLGITPESLSRIRKKLL
ncbi:MAG: Crp/Fnr family transcriptional regulator [Bacteroidales bacterium]|jgi:CRP-like cAMP-binding protein|nr:Crp/Fnr family transcriptional regulator [Bacteroidales bacterium]MDI9592531.1 Crp/Fnr family transcriptional regulator [Bacteroidota bacterium]MBP7873434.1 Crp/Fnr family transcriptional regulator [Bacteroidales bacterium]MCO6468741.1 Crp/Fnr family transcriptional regulator [Bacteroidales bacterium]MCZ2281611.1 Crp/Fnr family transcriptional regulator [Bacteroidales bacterium]